MVLRENWMYVMLEERQESSIALPEGVSEKLDAEAAVFDVIQVGPDVVDCQAGDKVITSGFGSMSRFKYQKKSYFVVREADVVCIMNRTKPITRKVD